MDGVKNDYIGKALDELIHVLGTKEFIDHQNLISLIHSKKVKECITTIALYLGLPIKVNLSYVPKGYRPNADDGFNSTHLVKTDWRGRGTEGIAAQVSIPGNLPFYGTSGMINFPISVRLSENCAENPATLISVMAHELSHVVLYSLWHKEKENEFYTDLTAMILGFAYIMKMGRKVVKTDTFTEHSFLSSRTTTSTQTITYGYLSDENFNVAFEKIETILYLQISAKKWLLERLKLFKKQIFKGRKIVTTFKRYLAYVDKNHNQKICLDDGRQIMMFHQHGYVDDINSAIKRCDDGFCEFMKFTENLKNFTGRNIEVLQQYESRIIIMNTELSTQCLSFMKDVKILKRYVSFTYRFKNLIGLV
jgi:hypothetical protein